MRRGGPRLRRGSGGSQLKPIWSLSCLRCCGPGSSSGSRCPVTPAGSWCRFWSVCVFVRVKRGGAGGTSVSDPPTPQLPQKALLSGPRGAGVPAEGTRGRVSGHAHTLCVCCDVVRCGRAYFTAAPLLRFLSTPASFYAYVLKKPSRKSRPIFGLYLVTYTVSHPLIQKSPKVKLFTFYQS